MEYLILIYYSEEDRMYISQVPDLPGCMSDGESINEAIKNTELIIKQWIKTAKELNKEIPNPKKYFLHDFKTNTRVFLY